MELTLLDIDPQSILPLDTGMNPDDYTKYIFRLPKQHLPTFLKFLIQWLIPGSTSGSTPAPTPDLTFNAIISKAFQIFNLDPDHFEMEDLQCKFHQTFHRVLTLYYRFLQEGYLFINDTPNVMKPTQSNVTTLTTNANDLCETYILEFNRLFEMLYYWELGVRSMYCVRRVCNPMYDSTQNTDIGLFRFNLIHWKNLSPNQKLLLYFLMDLAERGWRKKKDMCMERIHTEEGYDTRTWKPIMKIHDYINLMTSLNKSIPQWLNFTNPSVNKRKLEEHLVESSDLHFTEIHKDRNYFSYRNGIYRTKVYDDETQRYIDRWYFHRDTKNSPDEFLSKEVMVNTCCRYFPMNLELSDEILKTPAEWKSIPTPTFQKILTDQKFEPEVCNWMYILCGRLLHEVNDLDQWQVMPFLLGKAGTGKSTIAKVCADFFEHEDVATLSNTIEERFGIWALSGKFLVVAPEINDKCSLDQCSMQSMISGETVSVAKKHEMAETVERWKSHIFGAGNKFFGWPDNQGSLGRRFVIFCFNQMVRKADTKLSEKLSAEIPYLIMKCNRAYLEAVNLFGHLGLWNDNVLPKYFVDTRRQVAESTNSFVNFLSQCDQLEYHSSYYMQARKFKELYRQFCDENHFTKLTLTREVLGVPLESKGLQTAKKRLIDPFDNKPYNCEWVFGVRQIHNNPLNDNDCGITEDRGQTTEVEEDFD